MKNSFADIVENVASFQFESDESLEQIEDFKRRVNELEGITAEDRNRMLSALDDMKPFVIEELTIKSLKNL